jgi:hypothetical protein
MLKARLFALFGLLLFFASTASAQLPAGWRVLYDAPPPPDSLISLVRMPPGWHLETNGPGGVVYDVDWVATGRYALEWEVFVFPTMSTEAVGVVIAGRGLESRDPSYHVVKFTAQGLLSVTRRAGVESRIVVPAEQAAAFAPPTATEPGRNILRIAVEADSVRVTLNGTAAAAFAPLDGADGIFGFRVGTGTNSHVSRLDLTKPLAPPRPPRSPGS